MLIRDAVVHLVPQQDRQRDPGADYAIGLAQAYGCTITALICEMAVDPRTIEDSPGPGQVVPEETRRQAKQTAEAFADLATQASVPFETVIEQSYPFSTGEVFTDYARLRDLAVLGASQPISRQERLLAEVALFGSGRPIVLVPEQASGFAQERVMVAWDATPAAVHAIAGAMPLLRAAKEVVVSSVTDDKTFRSGQSGVELCRHLVRHDVHASFEPIQRGEREVASVLLDIAGAHRSDLLVMGGYAHSTLRGLIFGSATKGVFDSPIPLPILMAH